MLQSKLPLVAILRGIKSADAADVALALVDAGFEMLEVTLNSPDPFRSIEAAAKAVGGSAIVGAGTVVKQEDVARVASAGGELIVSPNFNADVVRATVQQGMISLPGVFSPSEMFAALECGADGLKLFPAEAASPAYVKATTTVLPTATKVFVVGGINTKNMEHYLKAGAVGFGFGSALYRPGKALGEVEADAKTLINAFRDSQKNL